MEPGISHCLNLEHGPREPNGPPAFKRKLTAVEMLRGVKKAWEAKEP
jgi:hypothetical protein